MKTVSMSGSPRENVGKKDAKTLRKQGLVPCVIYGGKEQVHFFMDEREFSKILFTPESYIIKLNLGEKEVETFLQDVQYHPLTDKVLHADFLEFETGKPVKVSVPVNAIGVSTGVLKGGSMKQIMRKVLVRALVDDIPDFIEVDITDLDIGDSFKVKDLNIENIECLDRPNNVIISVKVTRVAVEEVDEDEDEEGEGEGGEEGADAPAGIRRVA